MSPRPANKHRYRDHPPHWGPWKHRPPPGPWFQARRGQRRRLFLRFAGFILLMVALVVGGMAALALLFTRLVGGSDSTALLVTISGCGLALGLPLLAIYLTSRAFRDVATPLANVMTAAEEVAGGDFSVRVPEEGSREFRRLTQAFNHMASELERADRNRQNFSADVAHELRTPLHILQGNLEGLLDGVYDPTPDHIRSMLDETRALSRLVEDLETITLAEAGQLRLVEEPVHIPDLLADISTSFSGGAEAAGVRIDLQVPAESDPAAVTVLGDPVRLDQVLSNLLVNALRHTPPEGVITLEVRPVGPEVQIQVRDSGRGIPPEDLPFIFDRYWRSDRNYANPGGGLGLAIARQLVQAHGGHIQAESRVNEGTTFTINLPAHFIEKS